MQDWEALDEQIDRFEMMIPGEQGIFTSLHMHDWRPVFAKAKEIQATFNSRIRYPTKQARDQAWVRFNGLRSLAFERANSERSRFRSESKSIRDEILGVLKYASYGPLDDGLFTLATGGLGAFMPTTVEDMKAKAETVREAGRMLSENKQKMLNEHKDEVFERIQEVRQSHDHFWERYRESLNERRRESRERRHAVAEKIRANVRANKEKLANALDAYERVEANVDANRERLSSARSEEFAERVAEWIAEGEEKLQSISESVERIRSWIEEDENRLTELQARL